jgi:hypothetical protein
MKPAPNRNGAAVVGEAVAAAAGIESLDGNAVSLNGVKAM